MRLDSDWTQKKWERETTHDSEEDSAIEPPLLRQSSAPAADFSRRHPQPHLRVASRRLRLNRWIRSPPTRQDVFSPGLRAPESSGLLRPPSASTAVDPRQDDPPAHCLALTPSGRCRHRVGSLRSRQDAAVSRRPPPCQSASAATARSRPVAATRRDTFATAARLRCLAPTGAPPNRAAVSPSAVADFVNPPAPCRPPASAATASHLCWFLLLRPRVTGRLRRRPGLASPQTSSLVAQPRAAAVACAAFEAAAASLLQSPQSPTHFAGSRRSLPPLSRLGLTPPASASRRRRLHLLL